MTVPQTSAGAGLTRAGPEPWRRCKAVEGGERCTAPGIYRTWLQDCQPCRRKFGVLWCLGHPFCVRHAAGARAGAYEHAYEHADEDATVVAVTRMTGVLQPS